MIGTYKIIIQNNRVQFKLELHRNITILRGDSATGKTTLIDMIAEYDQLGTDSGVNLSCDKQCRVLSGNRWKSQLEEMHDSIVFIDEGNSFLRTMEFAQAIQNSDNYYVIAIRESLPALPYSVEEVYGIKNTTRGYGKIKRFYSRLEHLYEQDKPLEFPPLYVITEDSNSGYQFFSEIFQKQGITCISAQGKSNIYKEVQALPKKADILIIADGAAFGPEMERLRELKKSRNITLFLPESFEWIILKSDIIKNFHISDILSNPSLYIESSQYFSWERYFTSLLIETSKSEYYAYQKSKLNPIYLQRREIRSIVQAMPELQKVLMTTEDVEE